MQLAISTDTLLAGVHFPVDTAPADVGYKALAVNLSDMAAMGADAVLVQSGAERAGHGLGLARSILRRPVGTGRRTRPAADRRRYHARAAGNHHHRARPAAERPGAAAFRRQSRRRHLADRQHRRRRRCAAAMAGQADAVDETAPPPGPADAARFGRHRAARPRHRHADVSDGLAQGPRAHPAASGVGAELELGACRSRTACTIFIRRYGALAAAAGRWRRLRTVLQRAAVCTPSPSSRRWPPAACRPR